jgi:3-oxoacyl-[acyl-carrier protein] reductase
MRFEQQVIVVTGASRGIGREIALAFAREGGKVACAATTVEGAEATAQAIRESGGVGSAFACDVSDAAQVETLFKKIAEELGSPAVLVNNAGITRDNLLMRLKDEDWDRVISVNLRGSFLCIRAASRLMMRERYGRIVNVSSVIGQHGAAGQSNYAAAKAGLIGLTMSVAKELGSRNITCNAVAPGFIETDMTGALPAEFKEHVVKTAPAGRLGVAQDVAPAVLFFASKEAAYITGQTLAIDGGLMI